MNPSVQQIGRIADLDARSAPRRGGAQGCAPSIPPSAPTDRKAPPGAFPVCGGEGCVNEPIGSTNRQDCRFGRAKRAPKGWRTGMCAFLAEAQAGIGCTRFCSNLRMLIFCAVRDSCFLCVSPACNRILIPLPETRLNQDRLGRAKTFDCQMVIVLTS